MSQKKKTQTKSFVLFICPNPWFVTVKQNTGYIILGSTRYTFRNILCDLPRFISQRENSRFISQRNMNDADDLIRQNS